MSIITVGMDLAKNIFAVHGVNENGMAELVKPRLARAQLLPPCLIGMKPAPARTTGRGCFAGMVTRCG